ncbi:MAG TPA: ABC transporter ATP-binding protein [Candidatus Saccharimonadales bacterium]|nr:ABC transporter ATP-binding protein [Candidatus Saccharimonadales bacterium]
MADVAIQVDSISKSFRLPHEKQSSIKGLFLNIFRLNRTFEKQKVLKNISFQVEKGEFFGIVGRNGSGKSTLLKLLAGIYSPGAGAIKVHGKLTPFIELGVGFNPDLTGRQNVYLNGALLGFNRKEMNAMYQEIVDFAEIEKFMDQKLKNYSSGMQVRLAFSIAIQAQSDILLVDEVLAVGDAAFQRKCYKVFRELKKAGRTIVFVTHDMSAVKEFCDRALMLKQGKIVAIDKPQRIALEYAIENSPDTSQQEGGASTTPKNQDVAIQDIIVSKGDPKQPDNHFAAKDSVKVSVKYAAKKSRDIKLALSFTKTDGKYLAGVNSKDDMGKVSASKGKSYVTECTMPAKQFSEGAYYLNVAIADYDDGSLIDYVDFSLGMKTPRIYILEADPQKDGEFNLDSKWEAGS